MRGEAEQTRRYFWGSLNLALGEAISPSELAKPTADSVPRCALKVLARARRHARPPDPAPALAHRSVSVELTPSAPTERPSDQGQKKRRAAPMTAFQPFDSSKSAWSASGGKLVLASGTVRKSHHGALREARPGAEAAASQPARSRARARESVIKFRAWRLMRHSLGLLWPLYHPQAAPTMLAGQYSDATPEEVVAIRNASRFATATLLSSDIWLDKAARIIKCARSAPRARQKPHTPMHRYSSRPTAYRHRRRLHTASCTRPHPRPALPCDLTPQHVILFLSKVIKGWKSSDISYRI